MIELEFQLMIGKGRTGDFAVLLPAHLSITSPHARLPISWLHIHASHSAQRSVALWRQDDHVVFAHAWQESGVDSAGRSLHRLVAYTAREVPHASLARLLLWLYRQNFDQGPPQRLHEISPATLADDDLPLAGDERDDGAAALVLLDADACRVQSTRTVQGVVDALGFDQLGFLALVPNAVPSWPAVGPGVILSRSMWQAPADAVRFVGMGLRSGAVDLSGLMRLPRDRARRRTLALAVLTGDCVALGQTSDRELDWLLAQERTHANALSRASADQIAGLVAASKIESSELETVTPDQLAKLPPTSLAKMLCGRPNALGTFVAALGPGIDGVEELLPERAADLARARFGPVVGPERVLDMTAEELDLMEQAGIFHTMPFRWIAALRAFRPRSPVDKHLSRRMRELLPEPLAARLLGSTAADGEAPGVLAGNPPKPRAEWLAGIDFERLVEAGPVCVKDRAWRHWWADALRLHPGSQSREIATLAAPWSRETAAWLSASARDGEISADDARARIAAFLAARAPIISDDLIELLAAAGITQSDELAHVVRGRAPSPCKVGQQFSTEVKLLFDAGILTIPALQDALRAGLPIAALSGLIADATAIALVDPRALAPTEAPKFWHPVLAWELRRQMQEPAFWRRWPYGVAPPLLMWMREQVRGESEETLIDALLAATKRSRTLSCAELSLLSGGIAPLDLAWQIVEQAKLARCDPHRLVGFLDDGRLRSELAVLLRSELGTLAPAGVVPELTAAELIALHAVLHPVRDVVRQVMSRPSVEPEEEILLAQTLAAIRRIGHGLAPPPPTAEQAARRPAWVAALSEIPGWEHWRRATGEGASP